MENFKEVLEEHTQGKAKNYNIYINRLADPSISDEQLISGLSSLLKCILMLGKEHETLVGVILKIRWTERTESVTKHFQAFILSLVSAHTFYLKACLRMIAKQFMPDKTADGTGEPDKKEQALHKICFSHLHTLLQQILKLVPLASEVLIPLLDNHFPYLNVETYRQKCYVTNLLHVTAYLPSCRQQILEIIVDRLTKLDVRAPRDEIEDMEDESEEEMEDDNIFHMEEEGDLKPNSDLLCGVPGTTEKNMCHPEADRLDATLSLVLHYIHTVCYQKGELDWESTKKLYKELLAVFNKIILPTHASCHIQFIMFHVCSFKQPLVEGFLDFLWKKVQDPNAQPIFRQAAVAYMASMVSRATYIPLSTAKDTLQLMVSWIHKYIEMAAYTDTSPDVAHHGPFYSVCQAVFYMYSFRHKEILADKKGFKFSKKLNLQTIITSRLNPLKFCLPVVVKTFSSITRMHQLAFCDTVIEHNRRSMIPIHATQQVQQTSLTNLNPLDSFFPFDPCLLIRTRKYIVSLYREYEGVPVQEQEQETAQVDEEKMYDEDVSISPGSVPLKSPKTPTDFLMYGISPGFKHV